MVKEVEFILLYENGHTRKFDSRTEAIRVAENPARPYPKPRKLIRRSMAVSTETVKSWE